MSESEKTLRGILQRWSRRKLGLEQQPSEPPPKTEQAEPAESHEPGAANPPIETSPGSGDSAVEPFDLARLPPIESIDSSSDIRAFLAPGVPPELGRAALRRAWLSDPAIRDFVGLAENQWDFTNPDTVPGFGSLELTPELRRLLAGAFSEPPLARDADASQTTPAAEAIATTSTVGSIASTTPVPDPDVASQNDCAPEEREGAHVRPKHGGALPK
jgi:hypothetical protein